MRYSAILLAAVWCTFPLYGQQPEAPSPEDPDTVVVEVEKKVIRKTQQESTCGTETPEPFESEEEKIVITETVTDTIRMEDGEVLVNAPENTRITLGQNEVLIVEENGDTVRVKLGSRGISIVEGKDGTEVKIVDMEEEAAPPGAGKGDGKPAKKKKFKPHFAGVELGLNNYMAPGYTMTLPQEHLFMDLNTGRSWNVNLNILEYGFGLGTDKVGLVTGLGLEWTNYVFDYANSIRKDENGVITEFVPLNEDNIVKSKFNMTYVTAPLLMEFQIPAGKKRIHLSGGVIGGVKIASNTKIKYKISGEKSKEKVKGDYNLAPLRYGVSVRLGYRAINLYANYYLMPLFGENGGPELYPFAVGLTLVPF